MTISAGMCESTNAERRNGYRSARSRRASTMKPNSTGRWKW